MFFAVAIILKVCESFLFRQIKKNFGLYESSLDFQLREDQVNTVYEKQVYFPILDS